jgi:hypothetical protein
MRLGLSRRGAVASGLAFLICGCNLIFHTGEKVGKWTLDNYSSNVHMDNPPQGEFSFQFPKGYPGVHMISKTGEPLKVGRKLSVTFEVTGQNPVFEADGDTPEVRLFIGANFAYSFGIPNARPLKIGKQTLTVALTPGNWKDITGFPYNYDQKHIDLFNKSLPKCTVVAVIFGDEHGNAHGADLVSGTAHFKCISFTP